MKIVLRILYKIFVALVVALALFFVATLLPIPGNFQIKIVQSGSMEPTIPTGAVVIVKPMDRYQVDDVITFGDEGETPTTHRIVSERIDSGRYLFTTQGDANEDPDITEIGNKDIIGKVVMHLPFLGYILDAVKQPLGFIFLVGIPVGLLVVSEVGVIITEVKKARRKDDDYADEK